MLKSLSRDSLINKRHWIGKCSLLVNVPRSWLQDQTHESLQSPINREEEDKRRWCGRTRMWVRTSLFKLILEHTQGSYTVVVFLSMLLLLLNTAPEVRGKDWRETLESILYRILLSSKNMLDSRDSVLNESFLSLYSFFSSSSSDCRRLCLQWMDTNNNYYCY